MHDFIFAPIAWLIACVSPPHYEIATVADNYATFIKSRPGHYAEAIRINNLSPDHSYHFHGEHFRTLQRPQGKLLCRFATVNDLHIGESICGFDSNHPDRGPILHNEPGKLPYAEMMSRQAVKEISSMNPDAVLIKGDITDAGKPEDFNKFLAIWGSFGNKLHWVCGNHDAHNKRPENAAATVKVVLPGVILAMLDTAREGRPNGAISSEQLSWLEEICRKADRPVMVFGHHHICPPQKAGDSEFFGINPLDSEKLRDLCRRHACLVGYFAGHTHSSHVEHLKDLPEVPFVECGALKEFPGAWAEYRVYEGGLEQIMHRLSSAECLNWENRTSKMESGAYKKNHFGQLNERCFTINFRQNNHSPAPHFHEK